MVFYSSNQPVSGEIFHDLVVVVDVT